MSLLNLFSDGFYSAREEYDDRDYELAGGEFKLPQASSTYWDKQTQYNQTLVSKVSCTVHAAAGAFSDQTGNQLTTEQLIEIWSLALKDGASNSWGWFVNKAVQLIRKYMNNLGYDVVTFRMVLCSDEFYEALKKGYSVVTGYRGNKNYNLDLEADGILDGDSFPNSTYGHSIRMINENSNSIKIIVDNYKGRKYNTYSIKKGNLEPLWKNGVFFNSGYIFANRQDFIEKDKEKIHDLWVQNIINEMKAAGVQTDPFKTDSTKYLDVGVAKKMFDYWMSKRN